MFLIKMFLIKKTCSKNYVEQKNATLRNYD